MDLIARSMSANLTSCWFRSVIYIHPDGMLRARSRQQTYPLHSPNSHSFASVCGLINRALVAQHRLFEHQQNGAFLNSTLQAYGNLQLFMTTTDQHPIRSFVPLLLAMTAAAIAAGFYYVNMKELSLVPNPEPWGQLGDFFGGLLGPTFNLISMYLLIKTIQLQQFQLADARSSATAASAATIDHKLALKQSFEQTLFTWLHSYRELVTEVQFGNDSGRLALNRMWDDWYTDGRISAEAEPQNKRQVIQAMQQPDSAAPETIAYAANQIPELYNKQYLTNAFQFDTLIRTLYRLIKWIDESEITATEKFDYVGIVRSQVSSIEMHYLFLNGLTSRGEKFSPFLEKYAFFSNFDDVKNCITVMRIHHNNTDSGYSATAFKSDTARAALGL